METRTLNRGLPGEPQTLDPQLADDDFSLQVIRDLYEGLTAENSVGQIVPGVADSWKIEDGGTAYTFHLRPTARWSNGDRIVASEFVHGLQRAVDPHTASGSAGLLGVIKGASEISAGHKKVTDLGVVAIDDSTIRIELERPAPFVTQILSQPIAAPFHNAIGINSSAQQQDKKIGLVNGPYEFTARVPGAYIELTRNPYYWNKENVRIGKIRYVNAESEATELRLYVAGQLDMTFTIPMPDLVRISREFGSEVQIAPTLGTSYLALNLEQGPLKDNRDLREALSIAVDRELIAEHVMPGVKPAYSLVAVGTNNYIPPSYDWRNWSRERQLNYAQLLFARAGFSRTKPLHLNLYSNTGEGIQRVMLAIAGSWQKNLGIEAELSNDEFRVFLEGRKDRTRWNVVRLKWDADYDDPSSFLDIFTKENNQNDPAYRSPEYDGLISQAKVEARPIVRLALLRQAEKILLDDYPIIPIYYNCSRRLVKPYINGAQINPMNRTYSKNLSWKTI